MVANKRNPDGLFSGKAGETFRFPRGRVRGIGIDLVNCRRMAAFLKRHRQDFSGRLLTKNERALWQRKEYSVKWFAKFFAAKEAFFKTGNNAWMGVEGFRTIEIVPMRKNHFTVRAAARFNGRGAKAYGRFFGTPKWIGAFVVLCK